MLGGGPGGKFHKFDESSAICQTKAIQISS